MEKKTRNEKRKFEICNKDKNSVYHVIGDGTPVAHSMCNVYSESEVLNLEIERKAATIIITTTTTTTVKESEIKTVDTRQSSALSQ